jgi:hypothetical protein
MPLEAEVVTQDMLGTDTVRFDRLTKEVGLGVRWIRGENMANDEHDELISSGQQVDTINVRISHRIIELFSQGLYSSPHKAIEELVSNSFDAGAQNVHVILSPSLHNPDSTIVVIDDGESMDVAGLKQHWIIGQSTRRQGTSKGRRPIGKFGIGKLATYVLAGRLTHVCKIKGVYYIATMDYGSIDTESAAAAGSGEKGVFSEKSVSIPLRTLTEAEVRDILKPWTEAALPGYKAMKLFGEGAADSWTVAILSVLKDMGKKIQRNRLNWILRTAMPLRDDFKLYLDGKLVMPSKIDLPLIQRWIIGKDITANDLKEPCPNGLIATEDVNEPEKSIHRYGLSHDILGRITGYVELYQDEITTGKSGEMERSNGFFVYARERMVNVDDPGFGIERNLLRHGTFSRFRMVVHIDNLDEALRSSRESLQQGELYNQAQGFLHAVFNLVRNRLVEWETSQSPGVLFAGRVSSAAGSLTRKPLLSLISQALSGNITPLYIRLPKIPKEQRADYLQKLQERAESEPGLLTGAAETVELDTTDGLAIYDVEQGKLQINMSHPFAAAFHELYLKVDSSQPLQMYALTEILTEANLYYAGYNSEDVRDILTYRDELLRQFVRSSARRTAGMVANALMSVKDDENRLEEEMRASFEVIGFDNVIRIGGAGKPDGTAEAYLAAKEDDKPQYYKVGLEAKSGGKVTAHRLDVAAIARHMEDYKCDHHVVIGNEFALSGKKDELGTIRDIKKHQENTRKETGDNNGRTITLMYVDDLARLVRIIPFKRIGLNRLRELFITCITPEESRHWIDNIAGEKPVNWPYREILETIWSLAKERPSETVEYAAVVVELGHREPKITITKQQLRECCRSVAVMARDVVAARDNTVELYRRPDLILQDIHSALSDYPEEERKMIQL